MEKVKNSFNRDQNKEIHYACEALRIIISTTACLFPFLNTHITNEQVKTLNDILLKTSSKDESEIYCLIKEYDFETLFKDEFWLSYIGSLQQLNMFNNREQQGFIIENLKTIVKYFPKETEGIIVRELLTQPSF